MTIDNRWEAERADWIRQRSYAMRWPDSANRRIDHLAARARRTERGAAGLAGEIVRTGRTPDWFTRWVRGGESLKSMAFRAVTGALAAGAVLVSVGPALLMSRLIYGVWWLMSPGWGRLRSWPLASVGGVAGVVILGVTDLNQTSWLVFELLGLGPLFAAWRVRQWGWAAVASLTSQAGNRRSTKPLEVKQDQLEAIDAPAPTTLPLTLEPAPLPDEPTRLILQPDQLEDLEPVFRDEEPTFDDEPGEDPVLAHTNTDNSNTSNERN